MMKRRISIAPAEVWEFVKDYYEFHAVRTKAFKTVNKKEILPRADSMDLETKTALELHDIGMACNPIIAQDAALPVFEANVFVDADYAVLYDLLQPAKPYRADMSIYGFEALFVAGDYNTISCLITLHDFDVTLTGFDTSEIGLMLGVDDEIVQDVVPEVNIDEPTVCQRGELWQLGRHRLLCGSSTDKSNVAQLMDGKHSKLLFTSPPYSDMRTYNGDKELSVESIAQFLPCYEPFTALQAVNLGIQRKDGEIYPYWDTYIVTAKAAGLKLLAWNVWDKLTCGSVGQQRAMVPIRHEWIFCFGKEPVTVNPTWRKKEASIYSGGRYNKIRQADGSFRIARRGNETGAFKKMESLLELPEQTSLESVTKQLSEKGKIRAEHPATFPVALPSEYIVAFTDENDLVVEPFGGAGTTLIACEQLDRSCYCMELDAHYCDVIIKRWENFTGRKAEKIGG